ncbi:MAG: family 31 glucosidase [Lachnospiraceae bacterium]|jgi:alpha-D-xyloside xylohydrolase|nr:family 31 glucosidase [Lachnospiraceae bacterium]
MIFEANNKLVYRYDAEKVLIEAWGDNALRIRATKCADFPGDDWALTAKTENKGIAEVDSKGGLIRNGRITATITEAGKIRVLKDDTVILEEYWRNRRDVTDPKCSAIEVEGREFKPNVGGDYHLTMRLESLDENEKIYGMGQYQQPYLNLKGTDIELAHRNSQASVPFAISSLGYGLLWNNPAVGRAVFGKNIMSFEAYSTKVLDYWIVVGDTPSDLVKAYASVTGTVPMMPDYAMGFWQCKLRYQTQDELLGVAREYKRLGIPLDVIVVDFFHWPKQGEWKFDPTYWPNPGAMVDELASMGVKLMVSVWPTVDRESENFDEMLEKGYLIRTERGFRCGLNFEGSTIHYDATNPEARKYLWNKIKKNYYDLGIKIFWLDEAEPEYTAYDFDNYRYHLGTDLEIGNIYPLEYARTFYEGMEGEGQENIINLLRCAWAGSQKYGALVWSGDIASSFDSMRNQLAAGLNMGLAGIPWWTTDIGGFHGGDPDDPEFRELFVRWFEWGAYCPVMRLHGDREPRQPQVGTTGGATCRSGAANEIWSYGEEVFEICKKYIDIREKLRPYTKQVMEEAHKTGAPVMRTLFYEFPSDLKCWEITDEYMYGADILVAPVLEAGARKRKVYLPLGYTWLESRTGIEYNGGEEVVVDAPIDYMPTFTKKQGV